MTQDADKMLGVWVTPKSFFQPLRKEFDLRVDAAASPENAMLPNFFCKGGAMDAFKQDWSGLRVWCNPPYGRSEIYKWVRQCAWGGNISHADHRAEICVALLPARTDTRWFHDFIWDVETNAPRSGVEVRFLKGRIKFSGTEQSGKFPSMVVIFRKTN